jgi:Peptidase family S51/Major Facilitator Superfamily
VLAGQAMASLDTAIVNVTAPDMQRDLHLSGAAVQLVVYAYLLSYATGLITAARLGARRGFGKVFTTGVALFAASSLACGLAATPAMLVVARTVQVLADSGADDVLIDLIRRNAIVYAGYSAGACVLTPDLAGLERVDDIKVVANPLTTGLALLDRPFVPHVRSPGHPETATCDALAAAYAKAGRPHWALRDGEVLVVENCDLEVLS